jgi:hypothetical protein
MRVASSFKGPPSNKRVKLAARPSRSRIAFVRPHASVERLLIGAPGWTGAAAYAHPVRRPPRGVHATPPSPHAP